MKKTTTTTKTNATTNETKKVSRETKSTTKKVKVENANKVNNNYNDLYDILVNTIANKNVLTMTLNQNGYIATMKTKNALDYTTLTPNDYYYQLSSGTRILINAKRTKCQLWLTDDDKTLLIDNKIIDNNDIVSCNDSIRHYKTSMTIKFDNEWFNKFMNVYASKHIVKFA